MVFGNSSAKLIGTNRSCSTFGSRYLAMANNATAPNARRNGFSTFSPPPWNPPLRFPPAKVPMVVQGGGRSGGARLATALALGIPASPAPRYGRPSAMVVTVRGDSVLHAERAGRRRFADRNRRGVRRRASGWSWPSASVTDRDRLRAEGAGANGNRGTQMRPP